MSNSLVNVRFMKHKTLFLHNNENHLSTRRLFWTADTWGWHYADPSSWVQRCVRNIFISACLAPLSPHTYQTGPCVCPAITLSRSAADLYLVPRCHIVLSEVDEQPLGHSKLLRETNVRALLGHSGARPQVFQLTCTQTTTCTGWGAVHTPQLSRGWEWYFWPWESSLSHLNIIELPMLRARPVDLPKMGTLIKHKSPGRKWEVFNLLLVFQLPCEHTKQNKDISFKEAAFCRIRRRRQDDMVTFPRGVLSRGNGRN